MAMLTARVTIIRKCLVVITFKGLIIRISRGLAPVQGDVAAGEERSLTPREDKGIVMGLIGWDGVLG